MFYNSSTYVLKTPSSSINTLQERDVKFVNDRKFLKITLINTQ